jgi:hypothetical protein
MGVSANYKDSVNCRMEAEYAHVQRKRIIPIMVGEPGYKPQGWLGMLIGAKLWVDFTKPEEYEKSMELLQKQMSAGAAPR